MSTTFPTTIDSYTRPNSTDKMNATNVEGSTVIDNLYDAVEALEAKVGADSSAVATSHDYLLTNASSSDPGHTHTLSDGASDVTSSAAELNILTGVTTNATELNYLDGTTLGTVVASKALAVDSNKDLSGFGTVNFDNAEKITFDDSGGTARDTLQVDSSNNIIIGDSSNFNEVQIYTMAKCLATLSADQLNIATATHTLVQLDTTVFDVGSDFNTGTYRFVAPVSGYYWVSGTVQYANGTVVADKAYGAEIYVDGSPYNNMWSYMHASHTAWIEPTVSGLVYMAAGSYLQLYTRHYAGVDTPDIDNSGGTKLSVHLLSV